MSYCTDDWRNVCLCLLFRIKVLDCGVSVCTCLRRVIKLIIIIALLYVIVGDWCDVCNKYLSVPSSDCDLQVVCVVAVWGRERESLFQEEGRKAK